MVLAVYIGFVFFDIFYMGHESQKIKKNPNHDSRRLKFAIFENFTNNGELIRMKGHENKKKLPHSNHRSCIHGEKMVRDSEKKKMHAMRGRKDLDSRMLGGIGKGSEGQTQLQYFKPCHGKCAKRLT